MFPINDDIASRRRPIVTQIIMAVNILVFVLQLLMGSLQASLIQRNYGFVPGAFFNSLFTSRIFSELFTLISSQFLHGGWSHIIGNMLYLSVFGDNVEDDMGHLPFLLFYLGSGAAGALCHGFLDMRSPIPLIGASGAIAGLMGAYFVLYPGARIRSFVPLFFVFFTTINVPAIFYLGAWFLLQILNNSFAQGADTVAYAAHIGGFVVGVLVGLWWRRRRPDRWEIEEPEYNTYYTMQ